MLSRHPCGNKYNQRPLSVRTECPNMLSLYSSSVMVDMCKPQNSSDWLKEAGHVVAPSYHWCVFVCLCVSLYMFKWENGKRPKDSCMLIKCWCRGASSGNCRVLQFTSLNYGIKWWTVFIKSQKLCQRNVVIPPIWMLNVVYFNFFL